MTLQYLATLVYAGLNNIEVKDEVSDEGTSL